MLRNQITYTIACLTNLVIFSFASPSMANEVKDAFHISKTENKNRVYYEIKLNKNCYPANSQPVNVSWWIANENKRKPIEWFEERGYGIANQKVLGRNVDIVLKAIQNKKNKKIITLITSTKPNGECQVKARTEMNGSDKELSYIHIDSADIKNNLLNGKIVIKLFAPNKSGPEETIICNPLSC